MTGSENSPLFTWTCSYHDRLVLWLCLEIVYTENLQQNVAHVFHIKSFEWWSWMWVLPLNHGRLLISEEKCPMFALKCGIHLLVLVDILKSYFAKQRTNSIWVDILSSTSWEKRFLMVRSTSVIQRLPTNIVNKKLKGPLTIEKRANVHLPNAYKFTHAHKHGTKPKQSNHSHESANDEGRCGF